MAQVQQVTSLSCRGRTPLREACSRNQSFQLRSIQAPPCRKSASPQLHRPPFQFGPWFRAALSLPASQEGLALAVALLPEKQPVTHRHGSQPWVMWMCIRLPQCRRATSHGHPWLYNLVLYSANYTVCLDIMCVLHTHVLCVFSWKCTCGFSLWVMQSSVQVLLIFQLHHAHCKYCPNGSWLQNRACQVCPPPKSQAVQNKLNIRATGGGLCLPYTSKKATAEAFLPMHFPLKLIAILCSVDPPWSCTCASQTSTVLTRAECKNIVFATHLC